MTDAITLAAEPAVLGQRKPVMRWTPGLVAGVVLFGLITLVSTIGPLFLSEEANSLSGNTNLPISTSHWLGTDAFGRDMFARAIVATRLSLIMAFVAMTISVLLGALIGTSLWVAPRRIRELGLRFLEITVSYPVLLIAILIAAILGAGSWQLILAIGIANIPSFARLTANLSASVYQRDHVTTAKLLGVPSRLIITKHLLPNMAEPLLVQVASVFSIALVSMSALSFVGLGVQTPDYDLGLLLTDGLPAIYSRPLEVVGPTTMIVLLSLAAMLIGDGLAAGADPRSANVVKKAKTTRPALSAVATTKSAVEITEADPLVVVEDLIVRRSDDRPLVRGVSFVIQKGEILGVVGESGSGKSLTAMSLAQLLPDGMSVQARELRVHEMNMLAPQTKKRLATTMAMIYQDPGTTFNPVVRMGSQLAEVLRLHRGMSASDAQRVVVDALRKVQIVEPHRLIGAHPYALSGGMRQRAMIASALTTDAVLIIADEPTTALDVTVQAEILREFKRINREQSTAMLFISHDIGVVEALCDRILVMKDGEIVETVSGAQLRRREVSHPYTRVLLDSVPRLDPRKT